MTKYRVISLIVGLSFELYGMDFVVEEDSKAKVAHSSENLSMPYHGEAPWDWDMQTDRALELQDQSELVNHQNESEVARINNLFDLVENGSALPVLKTTDIFVT